MYMRRSRGAETMEYIIASAIIATIVFVVFTLYGTQIKAMVQSTFGTGGLSTKTKSTVDKITVPDFR